MQSQIASEGYAAEVHYIDEDANEVLTGAQLAREQKPAGIIFLGGNIEYFEKDFHGISVPCVLTSSLFRGLLYPNLSQVGVDDRQAGAEAFRYLSQNGHKQIGIIGGDRKLSYISRLRYEGFIEAAAKAGTPFDEAHYQTSSFRIQSGYQAMKKLLARDRSLSAVFCMYPLSKITDILHLGNPIGIVLVYLGFGAGLAVFMFTGFMRGVPIEVEEAAMKLMLNGALTLGTLDGANVEIADLVGSDNIYLFGRHSDEVIRLYDEGSYDAAALADDPFIAPLVDFLLSKPMLRAGDAGNLGRLYQDLTHKDWFMALLDLQDYIRVKEQLFADYENRPLWAQKMLVNIAKSGFFSADRTILQYNRDIWHL